MNVRSIFYSFLFLLEAGETETNTSSDAASFSIFFYSFRGQHKEENHTWRDLQKDNTEGQTLRGRSAV